MSVNINGNTLKLDSVKELLTSMSPEIYLELKNAVALGRWANGDKLSADQKELCLQAVIAYDQLFHPPEQRVGFVTSPGKACSK